MFRFVGKTMDFIQTQRQRCWKICFDCWKVLRRCTKEQRHSDQPGVNFINILRTNFSYEYHFGSFFYVHVTREKLLKQHSYIKCWWNWLQVSIFSTTILFEAFTQVDPISAKKTDGLTVIFVLLGSVCIKLLIKYWWNCPQVSILSTTFTCCFYSCRSQNRKNWRVDCHFCPFGISMHKSYSWAAYSTKVFSKLFSNYNLDF